MIFTHQVAWTFKPVPGSVRTTDHRLVIDNQGDTALYHMLNDPGQKIDISNQYPEIANRLSREYFIWVDDVTSKGIEQSPVPVGYTESPTVELPAPEAKLTGQLKFKGNSGWANDWIIDFSSVSDSCFWMIQNQTPGTYRISLELALNAGSVPCDLQVGLPTGKLNTTVMNAISAPLIESPDRVPRGEVYEREWSCVEIGEIYIQEGEQFISFKAVNQSGLNGLELKSLIIAKIK